MRGGAILTLALVLWPFPARAYMLESSITAGCHERLTAAALRAVRAEFGVPAIEPNRDEQALLDDLPFFLEADMRDVGGVALLLAVRDNDLKGNAISRIADLVPIHGDPKAQREHCLRAPADDEPLGTVSALASCRAFIREQAVAALDGLGPDLMPDPGVRERLAVSLALRGRIDANLPSFYVHLGQALHALQDGFSHSFRSGDDDAVGTLLNWVDFAEERFSERRDGPAHVSQLDACDRLDPQRAARFARAESASIALVRALLQPAATPLQKAGTVDDILAGALALHPDCAFDNGWCDAPERAYARASGCECAMAPGAPRAGWTSVALALTTLLVGGLALARRRARAGRPGQRRPSPQHRRRIPVGRSAALILLGALLAAPALATEPELDDDVPLTPAELALLRDLRGLGPRLGMAFSLGGSLDRSAAAAAVAGRFRLSPRWLVGLDAEWNPWIIPHPLGLRPGVASAYATVIRRFPMRFERVNLRMTLHAGMSVLLFDLYGARAGSVGPFFGIAPLGIDVHLRRGWMLVVDPLELELPIPHVTGVPLYYEQFRLMIGLQYGA